MDMKMDMKMDMDMKMEEIVVNNNTVNEENNTITEDNSVTITNTKPGKIVFTNTSNTSNVNETRNVTNNKEVNNQNNEQGGGLDSKLIFIGILLAIYYVKTIR